MRPVAERLAREDVTARDRMIQHTSMKPIAEDVVVVVLNNSTDANGPNGEKKVSVENRVEDHKLLESAGASTRSPRGGPLSEKSLVERAVLKSATKKVFPADALAEKAAVCCAEELVEGHAAAELVVKEVINDSASQPGPRPFMKPYIPRLPLPLAQNLLNLPSAEACPPQAILPAKTQPKARNGDKGIHCFGYICSIRCSRK